MIFDLQIIIKGQHERTIKFCFIAAQLLVNKVVRHVNKDILPHFALNKNGLCKQRCDLLIMSHVQVYDSPAWELL